MSIELKTPDIDSGRENDVMLAFADNGSVMTCFMGSVLETFSQEAAREASGLRRRLVEYYPATGPYIHDNRCRIARHFLQYTDKQWLWMIDNDIKFEPDALHHLLRAAEEYQVGILGGAYWNQYPGSHCYLSWLAFTPRGILAIPELPDSNMPVPVTAVGMGMTLIHRQVLQDVADMYPCEPWDTFGADILVQFEDGGFVTGRTVDDFKDYPGFDEKPIRRMDRAGEDVTFCLRAQRCGYQTFGLPSLVVEHYKPHQMAHGRSPAEAENRQEDIAHAAV